MIGRFAPDTFITRQATGVRLAVPVASIDLFLAHVEVGDGCWTWRGSLLHRDDLSRAYGKLTIDGASIPAHRFAYEILRGPITPAQLTVDHLCRNCRCCRPSHLEAVTHRENVLRGNRARPKREHCKKGHPYTTENTYQYTDGRYCRKCRNAASRTSKRRLRGAA